MNTKKWKSIAVSIEHYEILKQLATANDRSVSRQLAHIIKSVVEK